jgi:hypothetical protein
MDITDKHRGAVGEIEVFRRLRGVDTVLASKRNVILNSGMDMLAKALGGQQFVNGMYFAYDNDGVPYTDGTPPVERTASFYHNDGGGTRNFDRAGTLAQPSFETTDVEFNNNKVVFVAITTGVGVLPGVGNVLTDGVSQFYGAALAWLHPEDYQQDILFSAVSFDDLGPSHFEKIAGAQLGIRWGIHFEL